MASFFFIKLSGSSHLIQAFKHLMSMYSLERKSEKKSQKRVLFFLDTFVGQVSFSQKWRSKRVFLCVAISASRRFIWAIKQHYLMIFHFHFSNGGPFWFRGSEYYPKGMDWSKTVFKVFFFDLMAFLIHINVRAKKIPNFGF